MYITVLCCIKLLTHLYQWATDVVPHKFVSFFDNFVLMSIDICSMFEESALKTEIADFLKNELHVLAIAECRLMYSMNYIFTYYQTE